jgi:hypothetical protein
MLILVGMINIFQGFVALIWDERVVVTPNNFVLVDLTSWGWTVRLFGVLMIAISAGCSPPGRGLGSPRSWSSP